MVMKRMHSHAGAAQTERQSVSAAAAVDHMTREEAFAAMDMVQPLRPIMRDAVYGYWADKRKRTGKPFIRRLWAPTSSSDQNPFSVFRSDPAPVSTEHELSLCAQCCVHNAKGEGATGCAQCQAQA